MKGVEVEAPKGANVDVKVVDVLEDPAADKGGAENEANEAVGGKEKAGDDADVELVLAVEQELNEEVLKAEGVNVEANEELKVDVLKVVAEVGAKADEKADVGGAKVEANAVVEAENEAGVKALVGVGVEKAEAGVKDGNAKVDGEKGEVAKLKFEGPPGTGKLDAVPKPNPLTSGWSSPSASSA